MIKTVVADFGHQSIIGLLWKNSKKIRMDYVTDSNEEALSNINCEEK